MQLHQPRDDGEPEAHPALALGRQAGLGLISEVFYRSAAERDAERIARARAVIARHYDGLERQLDGRSHLCGDFSVADIGYFLTVTFATNLGAAPGDAHAGLRAWYERVLARPSVVKEVAGLVAAMQQLAA